MKILNYGPRIGYFALNPPEADARINILEGAVRSGKTWALHSKILYGCQYPVAGWKVITGVTQGSVYRNVLNDLFSIVGPRNYHYSSTSGFMRLFGTEWVILGAKDEGSEKYIRGLTVGYVVMDEVVLIPQLFFEMMLTRMSPDGARLYGSTNADSPLHWLKTGYIDNEALKASGLVRTIHTTMDDNPNLSQEYKDAQKSIYTGMFYKRFIQGLWVMAEGSIYKDAWGPQAQCDERGAVSARDLAAGVAEIPVTLFNAGGTRERVISVDYGTTNPCVFLDHRDDGKTVWVVNEYRWDSQREMRQKTDK